MIYPELGQVRKLAQRYNRIPVYREMDFTEVGLLSLVRALQEHETVFFFESARENRSWSRFSFIGLNPVKTVAFYPPQVVETSAQGSVSHETDVFSYLKREIGRFNSPVFREFGPFSGGLAGYFAFELVNYAGIMRRPVREEEGKPLARLAQIDDFIVYDNRRDRYHIASCLYPDPARPVEEQYDEVLRRLEAYEREIVRRIESTPIPYIPARPETVRLEFLDEPEVFMHRVARTKELIASGEAIQAVLSMRARIDGKIDPFRFYLKLRSVNPSPYMFFMKLGGMVVAGSSPETHVRMEGSRVFIKPIAGTVPRGETRSENQANRARLLSDEKEQAEHLMLVDLARNDLGRIAAPGSVTVGRFMIPEDFSHVVHLVSLVSCKLSPGKDMIDVLAGTFPAGTVSGAPKVRALEIIEEMESHPRGIYAGAVGYLGYNGHMDTCIAIRTAVFSEDGGYLQAGAGIVYDSVPEREFQEIQNKLKALAVSLQYAVMKKKEAAHVSHDR